MSMNEGQDLSQEDGEKEIMETAFENVSDNEADIAVVSQGMRA